MDIRERVAANLRYLRLRAGISQEDLAHRANVERAYVGAIERANRNPTIGILQDLATALEVDAKAFFDDAGDIRRDPAAKPLKRGRKPRA